MKGKTKKCIRERGFGFITAEDRREVFFQRSALQGLDFDNLSEGVEVEFNVEQSLKGPRAANVKVSGGIV